MKRGLLFNVISELMCTQGHALFIGKLGRSYGLSLSLCSIPVHCYYNLVIGVSLAHSKKIQRQTG